MNKPKILVFNKHYLPGYLAGGPIRTLANMVDRFSGEFDFFIVTLDRDLGESVPYQGIKLSEWVTVGKARVMYLAFGDLTVGKVERLVDEIVPDVIYLNSFFDSLFTQRVLWARRLNRLSNTPVILATRGEFSPGALGLKRFKKSAYLWFARLMGLYKNLSWQASSERERIDILQGFKSVRPDEIVIAPNLALEDSDRLSSTVSGRSRSQPLRVCFLSRISPMKNLDFALKVLADVKVPVLFTIYGPKELPDYWARCEALITMLPSNVNVIYDGKVESPKVKAVLSNHDIFFLPTRGENYGHVIHEALGSGLPVLLSDQTPWSAVVEKRIGWTLSLESIRPFVDVIHEVSGWNAEKVAEVSQCALDYARQMACDPTALNQNRKLFLNVISVARKV